MPLIKVRDVGFRYGAGTVFDHVDLAVEPHQRLALIGANGSGKSTLLLLLNGTLRPQGGKIFVGGEAVGYSRDALRTLRRRLGTVLQDPDDQLFAPTVEQDIAFGPLNNGMAPDEARAAAEVMMGELGIAHLARRPIHELSLGEKKRVALAGALITRPEIILLDEPTAGLDGGGIDALLSLLDRLHRQGATVILTTHDTEFALQWASHVAVLADRRILVHGECVDVLSREPLLRAARLRMPFVLDTALQLRALCAEPSAALPRNREALAAYIREGIG